MKALLVYPQYPVTFWSFKYALKYVSKKAAFPPLGLLTVGALLPKDWDIRLVDLNIYNLRDSDLEWADYVFISAMLVQKESVAAVLKDCRRLGKKVVAGGPLFNGATEEYLPLVDHLILNEAELTLPEFLKDLAQGKANKVYRSSDFPPLSITPVPRWDLIAIEDYASLTVQYSRGCPYNCDFCDITTMYGRTPRLKGARQFLDELQMIYDRGWRGSVFVVDDNFIGNRVAVKKMLPQIIEWMQVHDYPFEFFTEASINIADDETLIHLMVEAGFKQVFIGLETPNEESLQECSKNQNCERDLTASIRKLQGSGIEVMGGYIVGFDSDDEGIFARQIKFIQESGVVTAMVGLLNALPNTKLWQRLREANRLELTASGDNTDGSINFISKMDRIKLIEGYQRIIKTIYSPRPYYQRISQFLRYHNPYGKRKIKKGQIKALMKSILYIGILGNGKTQWYYWRLLVKTLLFYRRSFAEVITLMIYGQHFRKVAKKVCLDKSDCQRQATPI
ncbi:MAG: B12-binding domain-containing radical SAM protein [Syntrophorhabdaceae bacterium]